MLKNLDEDANPPFVPTVTFLFIGIWTALFFLSFQQTLNESLELSTNQMAEKIRHLESKLELNEEEMKSQLNMKVREALQSSLKMLPL